MKIYKDKDKVIIELDFYQHKSNCYDEEEEKELTNNLVGVICGYEQGIAQNIDLSYKGTQQIGEFIIKTTLSEEKFIELCKKLGIELYKYPVCQYCHKPIYGVSSWGKKGEMCNNCEIKRRKII